MKLRPIVKAAMKVDELVYQYVVIDVEDGMLERENLWEQLNNKYSDEHIIKDAENRLNMSLENVEDLSNSSEIEEYEMHLREARQLQKFISKFK
jgi:hypothetical protein